MKLDILENAVKSLENGVNLVKNAPFLPKQYRDALLGLEVKNKNNRVFQHRADDHFASVILNYPETKSNYRKQYLTVCRYYAVHQSLVALTMKPLAIKFGDKIIKKCLENQIYFPLYDIYQVKARHLRTRNKHNEADICIEESKAYLKLHRLESTIIDEYYSLAQNDEVKLNQTIDRVKSKIRNKYSGLFGKVQSHIFDKFYLLINIELSRLSGNVKQAYELSAFGLDYFKDVKQANIKLFINTSIKYAQLLGLWRQSIEHINQAENIQDGKNTYWRRLGMYKVKALLNEGSIQEATNTYNDYQKHYNKENDGRKVDWLMISAYLHLLGVVKSTPNPLDNMKLMSFRFARLSSTEAEKTQFRIIEAMYYYFSNDNIDMIINLDHLSKVNAWVLRENTHLKSLIEFAKIIPLKDSDYFKFKAETNKLIKELTDNEDIRVMGVRDLIEVVCG